MFVNGRNVNRKCVSIYNDKSQKMYSGIDGNSSVREIQIFQDWMDSAHPNWANGKNVNKNASVGYGNYNSQTKAAYTTYGSEYDKPSTIVTTKSKSSSTVPTDGQDLLNKIAGDTTKTIEEKAKILNDSNAGITADELLAAVAKSGLKNPTPQQVEKAKKILKNVKKPMEKNLKIGLIVGGSLLALIALILIIKNK